MLNYTICSADAVHTDVVPPADAVQADVVPLTDALSANAAHVGTTLPADAVKIAGTTPPADAVQVADAVPIADAVPVDAVPVDAAPPADAGSFFVYVVWLLEKPAADVPLVVPALGCTPCPPSLSLVGFEKL